MKKILIVVALVVLIALLPFVGNRVVKNTIEQHLATLSQNGLQAKLIQEEKSYLKTQLHYTITVTDEEKFLEYLQSFSSKELPPYTKSLLDGVVFASDIRYSNIPFSEKISIDLYPKQLSDETMEDLKQNDPQIYNFLAKLLKKRALLYHIDYDVTSSEFQGYMKDLNEHFTTKDDTNVSMTLKGIAASGKGVLLAPDALEMRIKHIAISMNDERDAVRFDIQNLLTTNSFESKTTYILASKVDSAALTIHSLHLDNQTGKQMVEDMGLGVKNFTLNASSDTQGKDAEFFAKVAADELRLAKNSQSFVLRGLNYDSSVSGVEKESFVKLQKLLEESSNTQTLSPRLQQELEALLVKIFAHGVHLKIADLSLKKLSTLQQKEIDGFKISMQADLKRDSDFAKKYKQNSAELMQNLSVVSDMRFSKQFYALINKLYPVDLMFANYKKEQNGAIVFHIEFQNGIVMINGKKVH